MVYITYFTELNLQICDYAQKRRICRENCKYVLDESLHGHFCPRWKAAKFCHPGNNDTCTVCFLFSKYPHMQRGKVVACVTQGEWSWRREEKPALFFSSSALVNAIVSRAEVCWPFNAEENFVCPTKAITKRRGEGKLCCREAIASGGPPMLKQDTELYKGLFGWDRYLTTMLASLYLSQRDFL